MEINLEQEFQILMRTVLKQINDKKDRGELTYDEATLLIDMVEDRMRPFPTAAWDSSGCSIGSDYQNDDGWTSSTC